MQKPRVEEPASDEERRLRQIELNKPVIALIQSWLDEGPMTPNEIELAYEFMRGVDEFRPERPLFSDYLRD